MEQSIIFQYLKIFKHGIFVPLIPIIKKFQILRVIENHFIFHLREPDLIINQGSRSTIKCREWTSKNEPLYQESIKFLVSVTSAIIFGRSGIEISIIK